MDLDNLVGTSIGGYEILRELGRGGMGVVYKAREESLNRMVAIKILPEKLSQNPSFIKRFRREAQAVAALEHPNIAPIYAISKSRDIHFFVMQYVKGANVAQRLKKHGLFKPKQALNLVSQITMALSVSHKAGIVHRDIKPQNIMIDESGRARVMDFGLAKNVGDASSNLTVEEAFLGTVKYASPEQCEGRELDGRSDLYSLGVVLYEILTGKLPYAATSSTGLIKDILLSAPIPLRSVNPSLTPELQEFVDKLLAKSPDDRYQDADGCLEAIRELQKEDVLIEALSPTEAASAASATTDDSGDGLLVLEEEEEEKEEEEGEEEEEEEISLEIISSSDETPCDGKRKFQISKFKAVVIAVVSLGVLGVGGYGGLALWDIMSYSPTYETPTSETKTETPPVQIEPSATKTPSPPVETKPEIPSEGNTSFTEDLGSGVTLKMNWIPAGTFFMGMSKGEERGNYQSHNSKRKVMLTKPFYLGIHEVTQDQYFQVIRKNPSKFKGGSKPVGNVSWQAAQVFCQRLSARSTSMNYRLPTEAEWEYACRAGTTSTYYWGNNFDGRYVWYDKNAGKRTHDVGTREPNPWGLYDMIGNSWEWCSGVMQFKKVQNVMVNPKGSSSGKTRVMRGGDIVANKRYHRSASRLICGGQGSNAYGFRVVGTPKGE